MIVILQPSPQEDEGGAPGSPPQRSQELRPAVRRAHLRPVPEAAGKVLELGRRVQRLQPPHLQPLQGGRRGGGLEVHSVPRLQVR